MQPVSSINTNLKILFLSLPLLVLVFFQEWLDYFRLWATSYVYGHGFLVFAGTLFLLFQRRNAFRQLHLNFSSLSLVILICLMAALLIAHAGNIKVIRMLLLPLILIAWGSTIWGLPFFRLAAAPLMLTLFGAPFWDEMSPALQWLTVLVDERALALLSIPATIEEFYITIPSGIFHVAHGCSGIRYLMVGLYLGAFYSCLTHSSARRTVTLIAFAALLSLLTNWVRVAWIIAAGHYTEMESSLIEDHEMFGWAVFVALTLIPFYLVTHRLEKKPEMRSPLIKEGLEYSQVYRPSNNFYKPILSATLPLALFPLVLFLQNQLAEASAFNWHPDLPKPASTEWKGPLRHAEFWEPQYQDPDLHLSGVYVSNEKGQAQLDFFAYNKQIQGKELIHYKNSPFNSEDWKPLRKENLKVNPENQPYIEEVNQLLLQHRQTGKLALIWYWYKVGKESVTEASEVQIFSALNKLIGDQRAGAWILSTLCTAPNIPQCSSEATGRLRSFLANVTQISAE